MSPARSALFERHFELVDARPRVRVSAVREQEFDGAHAVAPGDGMERGTSGSSGRSTGNDLYGNARPSARANRTACLRSCARAIVALIAECAQRGSFIAPNPTPDPARLFSERGDSYVRFIRFVGYPQGLRAYFLDSPLLGSGLRVLDAGCGTGIVTLALRDALLRRGFAPGTLHAFDLTPAMLERFRATLARREIQDIAVAEADVLEVDRLPVSWIDYDLVVSASMLEYLPSIHLGTALRGLRSLLKEGGTFVLFITRRNWLTRPLIGRWWRSNLYSESELEQAFREAGFTSIAFRRFPPRFRYLGLWGHIVEARSEPSGSGTGR